MNSFKRIIICSIILQLMFQSANQFSFRPKHFKIERAAACSPVPKYGGKLERFELTQPTKFTFHLDADIRFIKDITNPIQFHLKYAKCTLENMGTTCDEPESLQVNNVCDRFYDKNAVWSPIVKMIKPKFMCPLKKGVYSIRNGTFDLAMMSRLPIDGYVYSTTISFYEEVKNDTQPLQLMCFDSDVGISLMSTGRPRHKGRV